MGNKNKLDFIRNFCGKNLYIIGFNFWYSFRVLNQFSISYLLVKVSVLKIEFEHYLAELW